MKKFALLKSKNILFLILVFHIQLGFAQYAPNPTRDNKTIEHTYYSLSYSEKDEQAEWVYYELTREEALGGASRTDNFRPDDAISTRSATQADYAKSGYDRGHLAPAADMGFNDVAMSESFYFSNMSPQNPSFNRGIWKKLEALTRNWALEYGAIHIATGPILNEEFETIGANKVSIPKYYYKVIYDEINQKAIGFILPNANSNAHLTSFAVPIDQVEELTGIDFFYQLNDELENQLETSFDTNLWLWTSTKTKAEVEEDTDDVEISHTNSTSQQCKGITQSGNQCQRKTKNASGYCTQHEK